MKLVFPWELWGPMQLLVVQHLWRLTQFSSNRGRAKALGSKGLLESQRAKESSMIKEKEKANRMRRVRILVRRTAFKVVK